MRETAFYADNAPFLSGMASMTSLQRRQTEVIYLRIEVLAWPYFCRSKARGWRDCTLLAMQPTDPSDRCASGCSK